MHTFSRTLLTALAAIVLIGLAPFAAARVMEYDGWLYGEEADKAIDYAQENDIPIVLLAAMRNTDCPKCIGAGSQMTAARPNQKMIRIVFYFSGGELNTQKTTALFNKARKQVKDLSGWAPDMYYMRPDGQILGFVPYEEAAYSKDEATTVLQISEWIGSVTMEVSKADRDAEKGRYQGALDKIDKILEQEAKVSHLIQQQVNLAKKEDPMPETPVTRFFADLREQKAAEYLAMSQAELDTARKLVEQKELVEARRVLLKLVRGPEEFTTTAQSQQLMEQVTELMRAESASAKKD